MCDVACVHYVFSVCVCLCVLTLCIVYLGKSVFVFTGSVVISHEITLVNIAAILLPLCLRKPVF